MGFAQTPFLGLYEWSPNIYCALKVTKLTEGVPESSKGNIASIVIYTTSSFQGFNVRKLYCPGPLVLAHQAQDVSEQMLTFQSLAEVCVGHSSVISKVTLKEIPSLGQ